MSYTANDAIMWANHADVGSGNHTYDSGGLMHQQVEVANDDGTNNLTFTVNGLTFQINPGETVVENVKGFTVVAITATGAWRLICRSMEV